MRHFDIRFMKSLSNDTGHHQDVCQGELLVEAPNAIEALRFAEAEFCHHEETRDWTIYADRIEVRLEERKEEILRRKGKKLLAPTSVRGEWVSGALRT